MECNHINEIYFLVKYMYPMWAVRIGEENAFEQIIYRLKEFGLTNREIYKITHQSPQVDDVLNNCLKS